MEHLFDGCPNDCENGTCVYCKSGLLFCTVCNAAENMLPTHCPKEKIGDIMLQMIAMGQADYYDGEWVRPNVEWRTNFNV